MIRLNRTETDILRDGQQRLQEKVGITASNSTATNRNLLELGASELGSTWTLLNSLLSTNHLSTASGSVLEKIGELVQEKRIGAKRAMDLGTSNFNIYLDTSFASTVTDLLNRYYTKNDLTELFALGLTDSATVPSQIRFPSSITVTTSDGIASYNTVNPLTLTNSQLTDYSPIIANGIGPNFNVGVNALTSHNLTGIYSILGKISNAIKCTNTFAISNGAYIESDDNYRFRISNKAVSAATGNESAIRKAVLSVPGIVDMSLVKRSHGVGTFTIFPRSEDPILSDGLINAVREGVESVKSLGDIAYVEAPTYLAVSMRIVLRFSVGANISDDYMRARLSVMDYINNLYEGGEIIINEIIQRVMSVDEKIQDMVIVEFGVGNYDRTSGAVSGFAPLRLVNQVCDYNERFYINSNLCNFCTTGEF